MILKVWQTGLYFGHDMEIGLSLEVRLQAKLAARGISAPAKIVTAQPMDIFVNGDNPVLSFGLEVYPAGGLPFAAVAKAAVAPTSVSKYPPGVTVYVKFDPQNPNQVIIDHR